MLTQDEFEDLINDPSKTIQEDIIWEDDEDHSPAVEFVVKITYEAKYSLFVRGSYNHDAKTLRYAIIYKGAKGSGRIYALDLGTSHKNPNGDIIGETHKHRYNERYKKRQDREAYVPPDITASVEEPVKVWQQFCAESNITHNGSMNEPPQKPVDLPF